MVWMDSLLWVSQDWNWGIRWSGNLPGGSEGESASRFIQVIGQTQFHLIVGLRSLIPYQPSARDGAHLLGVTHIPWLGAPSIFSASSDGSGPSPALLSPSASSLLPTARDCSFCLRFCVMRSDIILCHLPVLSSGDLFISESPLPCYTTYSQVPDIRGPLCLPQQVRCKAERLPLAANTGSNGFPIFFSVSVTDTHACIAPSTWTLQVQNYNSHTYSQHWSPTWMFGWKWMWSSKYHDYTWVSFPKSGYTT